MATITGQQGASLTTQLASYLTQNSTNVDTLAITNIINQYLAPTDKISNVNNGIITNGIYKRFGDFMGVDLLESPDLVATKYPLTSAAWFFTVKDLWRMAEKNADENTVKYITLRINGGFNGLTDRIAKTKTFTSILC